MKITVTGDGVSVLTCVRGFLDCSRVRIQSYTNKWISTCQNMSEEDFWARLSTRCWNDSKNTFPLNPTAQLGQFFRATYHFHPESAFRTNFLHRCSPNTDTSGCLPLKISSGSTLTFQGIISNVKEIAAEYLMPSGGSHIYPRVAAAVVEVECSRFQGGLANTRPTGSWPGNLKLSYHVCVASPYISVRQDHALKSN